jgi:hypothetical protein
LIAHLRLRKLRGSDHSKPKTRGLAYCEVDNWKFDPRYTQGKCPICGWAPEGAPTAPRWLKLANRMDWEMFGLFMFFDLLVLLGLIVAHAAGLLPAFRHR